MVKQDLDEDQYPPKVADQRLETVVKGAFAKAPTALVPVRHGNERMSLHAKPVKVAVRKKRPSST
jgi:hypothetical protein